MTEEKQIGTVNGSDRTDELHPRPVVFSQPPPLQQGGAVAATELQPVVKDCEFWKQWGEKKSHYLKRVKLVNWKGIPGKIHPLTSNQLLLLCSRHNVFNENLPNF